ncbi:MAG: 3-oxo-tetronate 4-phosphate decarboxylase [Burkholderiales bacterium]|nr:3-oxo-tetronate 4-phosphate decarboxylase [Burkholderiales bacterium]
MSENALREALVMFGESLYARGYAHGSSGNLSARLPDGLLVTPTNSCLGRLDPARISKLDANGAHVAGDPPSKEAFLHLAMYQERPAAQGIVHLHCTHCVALSCLVHENAADVLPTITAYYRMRIRSLPLVPYYRPGDRALADAVRAKAKRHHAVLLANHGPVVAGKSLEDAVYNAEELEETAKLFFLLSARSTRLLDAAQIADLDAHFPS